MWSDLRFRDKLLRNKIYSTLSTCLFTRNIPAIPPAHAAVPFQSISREDLASIRPSISADRLNRDTPPRLEENRRQQEAGKREIFIRVTRMKPSDPQLVFPSFLSRCSSLNPLSSRCKNGSRIPRLRRSPWGLEVLSVRVSNSSNSPHCAPCFALKTDTRFV